MTKRLLDIFIAFSAILIVSPILVVVIIVLKFTGEGEVFYLQKRVGKNGKEFGMKLSIVVKNVEEKGSK